MKLTCEIVRDLLPTYVDGLAGAETAAAVEAHVAACPSCAEALAAMEQPEQRERPEQREVDYLKKQRRKRWLFALAGVAAALVMLVVGFGAWFVPTYLWGEELPADGYLRGKWGTATAAVSYTVTVENNNEVIVNGVLLNGDGFARVKFEEAEGVVRAVICSAPKEDFNSTAFQACFTAKSEVKQVLVGDMIAWEDGVTVSRAAAEVYAVARLDETHLLEEGYDEELLCARRFSRVYDAAGFDEQFLRSAVSSDIWGGPDDAEISSNYGLRRLDLLFEAARASTWWQDKTGNAYYYYDMAGLEGDLRVLSALLFAALPELEEVNWMYFNASDTSDEWIVEYLVTAEEITQWIGQDIKVLGSSAAGIQRLMEQLDYDIPGLRQQFLSEGELDYDHLGDFEWLEMDTMYLCISCDTDVPLERVWLRAYSDKAMIGEKSCQYMDGTLLDNGSLAVFELQAQVDARLTQSWLYDSGFRLSDDAWFVLFVTDENGQTYPLEVQNLDGTFGRSYYYILRGDFETGFTLTPA